MTCPAVLELQASAGNAAVASTVQSRIVQQARVQRLRVDLTAGGSVGDPPATNHREGVRVALDRMHVLWGIDNNDYGAAYGPVSALAPGAPVTDPAVLAILRAALIRTNEPVLVPEVSNVQYGMPISAGVGTGQPNAAADVTMVQDLLEASGMLSFTAATTERAAVSSGGPLNASTLPQTFAGISRLKMTSVAGGNRPQWAPLIRADEAGPAGEDKLADRTFQFQDFMVFVPSGAVASLTNDVHLFFSAGGVVGAGSHVEHHGLRGSAEGGSRILIGIRGQSGQAFTISDQQIRLALESAGRPATVNSITISAHSRGNQGLAKTLRERLLVASLISHITVLDANDQAATLMAAFRASGVPMSRISADTVTTGGFGSFRGAIPATQIDPAGVRAIGYARLILDASALGRVSPMPATVLGLATALGLPARGTFTAASPAPTGKININSFIAGHRGAIGALLAGERTVTNVGALSGSETTSPYAFVEWNDLLNLRDASAARSTWRSVTPGIYSHHLFVAEVGGDFLR